MFFFVFLSICTDQDRAEEQEKRRQLSIFHGCYFFLSSFCNLIIAQRNSAMHSYYWPVSALGKSTGGEQTYPRLLGQLHNIALLFQRGAIFN